MDTQGTSPSRNSEPSSSTTLDKPVQIMPLTIDHMCIIVPTAKVDDIVKFLLAALAPFDFKEIMRPVPNSVGLGDQAPFFWITGVDGDAETLGKVMQYEHTAFNVASRSFDFREIGLPRLDVTDESRQRSRRQVLRSGDQGWRQR